MLLSLTNNLAVYAEWAAAVAALQLSQPDLDLTAYADPPRPSFVSLAAPVQGTDAAAPEVVEAEDEEPVQAEESGSGRTKAGSKRKGRAAAAVPPPPPKKAKVAPTPAIPTGPGFYSILAGDALRPPVLATPQQLEQYIIAQQKKALLAEYL